jgi:hypothetical protein
VRFQPLNDAVGNLFKQNNFKLANVPAVTEELPIDTIHQKICSKKDRINY